MVSISVENVRNENGANCFTERQCKMLKQIKPITGKVVFFSRAKQILPSPNKFLSIGKAFVHRDEIAPFLLPICIRIKSAARLSWCM